MKPMEDLEGEYVRWIEMPVVGCLGRTLCLRIEQDQCMALARLIGQNTRRTAPTIFCANAKELCPCLVGDRFAQIPEEPLDE